MTDMKSHIPPDVAMKYSIGFIGRYVCVTGNCIRKPKKVAFLVVV
jgi:hypothetical protein